MPLEIEVKLKVESHEPVRGALRRMGARYVGKVKETNRFFDRPDRSLLKANSGLRVRTEEGLEGSKGRPALLTYKGPPLDRPLSPREAFDVTVEPAEQMVAMIGALGFVETLSYEKVRESWEVGGCKVELDEMPVAGRFVEVEGPEEEAVVKVQRELGLAEVAAVRESYVHMMDEYVRRRGGGTHVGLRG